MIAPSGATSDGGARPASSGTGMKMLSFDEIAYAGQTNSGTTCIVAFAPDCIEAFVGAAGNNVRDYAFDLVMG